MGNGSGKNQFNFGAYLNQVWNQELFFTFFNIEREGVFWSVFVDLSEKNSWILMKIIHHVSWIEIYVCV